MVPVTDAQARRARMALGAIVVAVIVSPFIWSAAKDDSPEAGERLVARGSFSPWPFTVGSGVLRCHPGEQITFETGGIEYGLNGLAAARNYPPATAIWADDPSLGHGLKVDISAAISAGRALC
ncbi:hypothetical protein GCM10009664_35380 [Kitasatospora gansuensis]